MFYSLCCFVVVKRHVMQANEKAIGSVLYVQATENQDNYRTILMGWAGKYDYYYYFRFLYNGFFQKLLQGRPSAPYVFQCTCGGWW